MKNKQELAFPFTPTQDRHSSTPGMTLRDYFAAKAMQAMISNPSIIDNDSDGAVNYAASAAYKFADAMLCARESS
ncbi:hypothetical protein [Citrobacter portucalensis]|uniref:hypothetical protein n=1 Tax=Citrobacter portucalensis TaxID=1639133 RepID=UPI001F334050|nr:hypothetical protein [Citrobacter portucalensis]